MFVKLYSFFRTQHARVLVGSFLISTLIITSGYKGTLKSFLIAKEVPKPIDSIEQLNRAILNQVKNKKAHFQLSN